MYKIKVRKQAILAFYEYVNQIEDNSGNMRILEIPWISQNIDFVSRFFHIFSPHQTWRTKYFYRSHALYNRNEKKRNIKLVKVVSKVATDTWASAEKKFKYDIPFTLTHQTHIREYITQLIPHITPVPTGDKSKYWRIPSQDLSNIRSGLMKIHQSLIHL